MSSLLEAWQTRQPLAKETVILLMRAFTLRCLDAAYRYLGITDEEIQRLLKGGRLTEDRIGHYKQSNYKPVAGLTPFFKQFQEESTTWDRVMIGTSPTGGNDWLASLRINTTGNHEGYRIVGIYVGLLRWGNSGLDIQESIVAAAREAWTEHQWPFAAVARDQSKDHLWGTGWHPGDWTGTEEDLIDAIGARMAALIPVLRSRQGWRSGESLPGITARFESLGKVEEVVNQDPVRGSYQFAIRAREAERLTDQTQFSATVLGKPVRFQITSGARAITSCEGAYATIREVGLALGMRHGDRAIFTPDASGTYLVERSAPPALLVKLGNLGAVDGQQTLAALESYLQAHPAIWFGVHSGNAISDARQHELRNAIHRSEAVSVYLMAGTSAGGDGEVSHVAQLGAVASSNTPMPPPSSELLPGPTSGQPCRVWLRLINLRREVIPLGEFTMEADGTPVQRDLRQPLIYVRRQAAAVAPSIFLLAAGAGIYEVEATGEDEGRIFAWPGALNTAYTQRLQGQETANLYLFEDGWVTQFWQIDHRAPRLAPSGEFRLLHVIDLPDPIPLDAFVEYDSGERITPQMLHNAVAYVRFLQCDKIEVAPARVHSLSEILQAFADAPTLVYDPADLINLHHALHALKHKHFVILHGVSGTGKSRFAQAYANALYGRALEEPENPHYCLVPVQPTWQDRTPLLGYFNPLTERYHTPDFLTHVLKAAQDPDRPYIICLDEMNLAVVEHYFADFLSAWESGETITLHDRPDLVAGVPDRLRIPANLLVIGTVNIDETTHGFSPKVLDRAFTVELTHVDVSAFGRKLVQQADAREHAAVIERAIDLLASLHEALVKVGLHFAYRTVDEICRYLICNAQSTPSLPEATALDLMILQKVLPKLRGDDRLLPTLEQLHSQISQALGGACRCCAALERMMDDGRRFGTFQFWR